MENDPAELLISENAGCDVVEPVRDFDHVRNVCVVRIDVWWLAGREPNHIVQTNER
jgi:hypothetical protein